MIERRTSEGLFEDGDISEGTLRNLAHRLDLELYYLRWGAAGAAGPPGRSD